MKNFFKKVAFVLALAMVLSNIGPAAKVSAAEVPGLTRLSRTLYVGGDALDLYPDSCWTPSQNYDGYKVTYDWDRKDIIDVALNGRITPTGNAVGKAVVTVTYTPMGNNGRIETAEFTVIVRRNATAVKLRNAVEKKLDEAFSVGQKLVLTSAKSISLTNQWKTGNFGTDDYMTVCSDNIDYEILSGEDVISIDKNDAGKYELTALAAGTATFHAYTYQRGDKNKEALLSSGIYEITVTGGLVGIVQKDFKTFEIAFAQELEEKPEASEFTIIKDDDTKQNIAISNDVKLSDDKKTVTLTTFLELNDGANYILTYDEENYPFTATDAEPYRVDINTRKIEYDTETEIVFSVYDKNDVEIKRTKIGSPDDKLDFEFEDINNGYVNGDNLVIWEKGKTVTVIATYHSGDFNEEGKEIGNIFDTFTIIAIDQIQPLPTDLKSTITDKDSEAPDWNKAANREIYVNDINQQYIHIYLENSKKEDVTKNEEFTIESANENVLIVGGVYQNDGKGIYAPINAVSKDGTVNVIVKKDGKVFVTIPITIKVEKTFKNFDVTFDNSTNTVSNSTDSSVDDKAVITVTFKDQYTKKINIGSGESIEVKSLTRPSGVDEKIAENYLAKGLASDTQKLTFSAVGLAAGTYTYRITYKNVSKTVSIIVQNANQDPNAKATYRVVLSDTNVDISYNKDNKGKKEITVRIAKLVNNVVVSYENLTAYTLDISKGNDTLSTTVSGTVASISLRTVDVASVSGGFVVEKEPIGAYQVTATDADDKVLQKVTFVVSDNQKPLVGNQVSPTVNASSYVEAVKEAFNFKYDGGDAKEADTDFIITSINTANKGLIDGAGLNSLNEGNMIYVKDIIVLYKIPDTDANVYYEYKVTLNRAITIK